ncbi:MAG TPA: hypothetical protein EYG46_14150 [Myxococcales bacterium]|nr:hypothetical protein [Myxococcales bacterium]HIM02123.1 hypothetical protein [Myxococcales bacterium]
MRQKAIASLLPLALTLSLLPFAAFAASEQPSVTTPPQPKSALFIGNSFTYYNNSLHMHVLNITKSASRKQGRDEPRGHVLHQGNDDFRRIPQGSRTRRQGHDSRLHQR